MTLDCVRRPVVVITANVRMGEEKERGIEGGRKGREREEEYLLAKEWASGRASRPEWTDEWTDCTAGES